MKNDFENSKIESSARTVNQVGFYSAVITVVLTLVTFGFAMTAIPISGANCPENCVDYPYLDTVAQYPKDFLWMPLAILMILAYVTLMVSIHASTPNHKKIFSQIGLAFALIAATILAGDYFVQFSSVPMSLMNNETEGLAMLIQYNPHGVFIALEEMGYLLMSFSFLFMTPVLVSKERIVSAIRWVFIISFIITIASFIMISIGFGLERLDRFEVVVISVNWLVLIVNGVLLAILFRKLLKAEKNNQAM
jgi:hypothetical protein